MVNEVQYFDESKDWTMKKFNTEKLPSGISYGGFNFFSDAAHRLTNIPAIVAKGDLPGPTLGILAGVHGNELNGIMTIHHLFENIDVEDLSGTLIAIPVVNMYGYLTKQRSFIDGNDLNRVMPGIPKGTPSEIYAHRLITNVISNFDYLIDIHTASFGRINSHYVRADLSNPKIKRMAELQDSQIIVHTTQPPKSIRICASNLGIPSITVELGNPQRFQKSMVNSGIEGIKNVMSDLAMIDDDIILNTKTVACKKSYWLRVDSGGILYTHPDLLDVLEKDEEIAYLTDIFGRQIKKFKSPEKGIVVGKSTNPVTFTGGRILHLGIMGDISLLDDGVGDSVEDFNEDY